MGESDAAAAQFRKDLCAEGARARCEGRMFLACEEAYFWLAVVLLGAATIGGVLPPGTLPFLPHSSVPAWLVSVCAGAGGACQLVGRQRRLVERANWQYALSDLCNDVIKQLDNELPRPVQREDLAKVSAHYRKERLRLAAQMRPIVTKLSGPGGGKDR